MRRTLLGLLTVIALLGLVAPGADARGGPPAALFPDVTVHDAEAAEGDGVIVFEVTIDHPTNRPVHVWYSTRAGTAQPFRDYVPVVRRKATIARGETSTTIEVHLIDNDETGENLQFEVVVTTAPPFIGGRDRATGTIRDDDRSLHILHINDHHSHLQPDSGTLTLDGVATSVLLGGFPQVVNAYRELLAELDGENVVKVHAGDAITGTLYYSLFKGEADAALMNELCFDVFALGNHEFDDSDAGLAQFLDWLAEGDCNTPVLAANVVPEVGTPLAPTSPTDYIQPYVVESYDGFDVGYIGIDIANKTRFSSSPLPTTQFLDELTTAQHYIDELTASGVDQIVLVTHYGYGNDLALAQNLRGVDVIVGGDSHTLLGNDLTQFGLSVGGPYPTRTTDAEGNLVCVVQAWQYSWVVGQLEVVFDSNGDVVACDGTPHVLVNDSFSGTGVDPDRARQVVIDHPELRLASPDPAAQAILDTFRAAVAELEQAVIGEATENLCLERIPNQGRSNIPGCREQTAVHGGDIQQLVTEAFRQRSFEADIAIQNAGGVRVDIPAGPITIADAYVLLPFANTMVNLEMTGAEIKQVIEEAGAFLASDPAANSGAYPYAAGLRWDADLSAPTGQRFTNMEVRLKGSDVWEPLDPDATYVVVTNSFAAGGGDGYFTFADVVADGRATDTFLDYAQTFIDYVVQDLGGVVSRLPHSEYSTQTFVPFS
jgi:5'-nucleotidase / UDP-sugar diphosphatase